jgi:hypothetical protein
MNCEQECYGRMFPSVVEMALNRAVVAKVLRFPLQARGCGTLQK